MTQDDPTKSIDAQIGEHMAAHLSSEVLLEDVRYIDETDRATLKQYAVGTVVRTYLPEYDLENCDNVRISIVPDSMTQTRIYRDMFREDYFIDTVVHRRIMDIHASAAGRLPSETVENRQETWRAQLTEYADEVTKIADQVRLAFERKGCCVGANVNVPRSTEVGCARWLSCQRPKLWERAQLGEMHVVFCVIRHTWFLGRPVVGMISG